MLQYVALLGHSDLYSQVYNELQSCRQTCCCHLNKYSVPFICNADLLFSTKLLNPLRRWNGMGNLNYDCGEENSIAHKVALKRLSAHRMTRYSINKDTIFGIMTEIAVHSLLTSGCNRELEGKSNTNFRVEGKTVYWKNVNLWCNLHAYDVYFPGFHWWNTTIGSNDEECY